MEPHRARALTILSFFWERGFVDSLVLIPRKMYTQVYVCLKMPVNDFIPNSSVNSQCDLVNPFFFPVGRGVVKPESNLHAVKVVC